jgi:hypothetical protein
MKDEAFRASNPHQGGTDTSPIRNVAFLVGFRRLACERRLLASARAHPSTHVSRMYSSPNRDIRVWAWHVSPNFSLGL